MNLEGRYVRSKVAGLVKSIIAARVRAQPAYREQAECQGWTVPVYKRNAPSVATLLQLASVLWKKFYTEFGIDQDSISGPNDNDDKSIQAISLALSFLHGDPKVDIRAATSKKVIKWDDLANWCLLREIRDVLDELPWEEPSANEDGPHGEIFWYSGKDYKMPRGQPMLLVGLLWSRKERSCHLSDLDKSMFRGETLDVKDIKDRIRGVRHRANQFFDDSKILWYISVDGETVRLTRTKASRK